MRVVAAMSGGVDSAVAASRMLEAGHEVVGVHLALSQSAATLRESARGCCTIEDAGDARRVADKLGIPFYVWDMAERFKADVVEDFVAEYEAGRTPNPCLRCNEKIKFAALLDKALALGFDAVATGHYAQIVEGRNGRELHRAVDMAKDQSYVLGVLDADQLAHSFFPLGDTTKPQIREEAASKGFYVANKPDSHDICFIADGDTQGYLAKRLGKALQIHDRDSHDDVLAILAEEGAPERTVLHCFSGDIEMARECVERGYYLSFSGTVTFKNNEALRDALSIVPLDQLLVETDAPYLTPHPHRGAVNDPYLVPLTVRRMADVLAISVPQLCEALSATSERVYGPWA